MSAVEQPPPAASGAPPPPVAASSAAHQTHSPCKDCSKLILQSGIKRLVYIQDYKDTSGLDFLKEAGIEIKKYDL